MRSAFIKAARRQLSQTRKLRQRQLRRTFHTKRIRNGRYATCQHILARRYFAQTIHEKMREVIPREQERVKELFAATKDKQLGTVSVQQAFQGMRGVKAMIYETSALDPDEGIRFRGLSIPQLQKQLPTATCRGLKGGYFIPESLLWLMLTGEVPTNEEAAQLSEELTSEPRTSVPKHVRRLIDDLPVHQHPMSQFASSLLGLQTDSKFAKAYEDGVHKSKYWEYALDDTLDLIARLPYVTARIYRHSFRDGMIIPSDPNLDWSANWAHMAGFDDHTFHELMRMYFTIHTDHEGGNVSAHTTHLVGSALSDPYLSLAAGICGLAGPLHGLANQECLRFIKKIKRTLGDEPCTPEFMHKFVTDLLGSGQVVPGFGHAVLRVTDPRYVIQREFALENTPDDEIFKIVSTMFDVVPPILREWGGGKIKSPFPNVDAHSGQLLQSFGLNEEKFYTVLFGMSRAYGVLSSYVISRALAMPIERPKSVTTQFIEDNCL